jgi:putative membrane protein
MSDTKIATAKPRSLVKGLVAGVVGGLAGAVAMAVAERLLSARSHTESGPHDPVAKPAGSIHWGFGAGVGAAYGAVAEFFPAATAKQGASFGMTLDALTHEGAQPARIVGFWPFLKLARTRSQPPDNLPEAPDQDRAQDQTVGDRASEAASHVIYAVTTETVRGFVRKRL